MGDNYDHDLNNINTTVGGTTLDNLSFCQQEPKKSKIKPISAINYSAESINVVQHDSSTFSRGVKRAEEVDTQKLEVGAGAKINQNIYDDPNDLDFWKEEAEGVICINYCSEEDVEKILEAGKISLEGHSEGFLKDIPVCD